MFNWDEYSRYRISPKDPRGFQHSDLIRAMELLQLIRPEGLEIEQRGNSFEGRSISKITIGHGPQKVLAWSQMHGDEPTHTAALLDIINFLQTDPNHPSANAILSGCTLQLILMLNPDGAHRDTRRNAQDIDINRDALHLQSPEGRILRDAVESIQPDFALNLHNQRPRTTVGQSKNVASYSLLVPPIDAKESSTDKTDLAKKLASYISHAVADHCPGSVSRYNADFMPRCFGEWVQQQNAATVTIEAGGWSSIDIEPLVQLHFYGLIAGLEAIADASLLRADPSDYDSLPATGEHDLFDLLLRGVSVLNGMSPTLFRADLGINVPTSNSTKNQGSIVDFGDLCTTRGKTEIDAADLTCLPGRFAWSAEVTPNNLPDSQQIQDLLASGVTTVLGHIDLTNSQELAKLEELHAEVRLPVNLGFLASLDDWSDQIRERLIQAISLGILGVVTEKAHPEAIKYLDWFHLPRMDKNDLPLAKEVYGTLSECALKTHTCAQRLGLVDHGAISTGKSANLLLVRGTELQQERIDNTLQLVLVGGNIAFSRESASSESYGKLLIRNQTANE